MSWLSPEIDHAEIRQRFPEMQSFDCDPAIITAAISDAEDIVRPLITAHWTDGAPLAANATVKTIVRKFAVANIYRSSWGVAAFAGTFNDAAKGIRTEAFEELDRIIKGGVLAGVSRGSPIKTNFGASKKTFDMGEPEGWEEPTSTNNGPEDDADRRFT